MNRKVLFVIAVVFIATVNSLNKYSKEANDKENEEESKKAFKTLDKPFRMNKLNLLWSKAQMRLSEPKLKSLYSELKIHDKEEITWKRLRTEGKDKDGLKEAELRKKLLTIMDMYGLLEHFEDAESSKQHTSFNEATDDHINKSLFKDKKLNKLWLQAEMAGFTSPELSALKEEFDHHQNKIDEYYSILSEVKSGPDDQDENSVQFKLEQFNTINPEDQEPKQDYIEKANTLRNHHRKIRDGYDRLQRLAAKGPDSKDFIEPKVQGLWKLAVESNFSVDELESLRTELLHYEHRLLKLRHLHAEVAFNEDKVKGKGDGLSIMEENIKKQSRKVEKLHLDLETRIMQKHIEL